MPSDLGVLESSSAAFLEQAPGCYLRHMAFQPGLRDSAHPIRVHIMSFTSGESRLFRYVFTNWNLLSAVWNLCTKKFLDLEDLSQE